MFGIYSLIVAWWRARQRKIDLEILWPICVTGAGDDIRHAKAAFAYHALKDPAWMELGDVEILRRIDALEA
jgi:hypothetical protein